MTRDDQPFRHFTTRQALVAWISKTLFDWPRYTVRSGLLKGMRRRGGLGWVPVGRATESPEHRFWKMNAPRGLVVYDVGAFHGLMSMFFARHAVHVVAYEPNSRNRLRLTENLALNKLSNVTVRPVGVGSKPAVLMMDYDPLFAGGATVRQGDSLERAMNSTRILSESVLVTTLDIDIAAEKLPPPNLVKIDIEGLELAALQGAVDTLRTHSPALFLEMHGETMNEKRRKVREIIDFLAAVGYEMPLHVESGHYISARNSEIASQGHLYYAGS